MSTKRVFFALWPDNRQRDRLRDVITPVAKLIEGRLTERSNWHVTLPYIGEFDSNLVPDLLELTSRIDVQPFRLSFDRLEFWPRPKIAVLAATSVPTELEKLVADLNAALQDFGIVPEERTYRPHITVARSARSFTTERLTQRATTEWSGFELMESVRSPGHVRYEPIRP